MEPNLATSLDARLTRIEAALARLEATHAGARTDELLQQLPAIAAIAADVMDQRVAQLAARGVDVEARLRALAKLAEAATDPQALAALDEVLAHHGALLRVVQSGLLAPATLDTLGRLAAAVAKASTDHVPTSLFGALRAAGAPPVQRALGFALSLARHFGEGLSAAPALPGGAQ